MRSIVKAGALLLWATAGALGGIVKLNQTAFTEGIANLQQSHDTVLVVFHRASCGACKRLAPALEVMARDAEQYKLAIVKVESTTNPDLAREFGVKHLPTVKFAHHGGDWMDFPGRANLDSLREFARRMVAPAVAVWEGAEDLSRAAAAEQGGGAEGGRIVFVLREGERGAAGAGAADGAPPPLLRQVFQAAARQLRHVALFAAPGAGRGAAAVESHIASLVKGGAKPPYVVRYSPSEGLAAAFAQGDGGSGGGGAEPQLEALKEWVLSNNHPFLSHLESYDQYWQLKAVRDKFLAIVMVDGKTPEHAAFAEQAERVMRDGGAALHARVAFCVMDSRVFRDELEEYGVLQTDALPRLVIASPADRAYWDRPEAQTAEAMAQFIGDVLSGEAQRRAYGQSEYLAFFYRKWRGKLAAAYPASLLLLVPLLLILYVLLFDKEKPKGA